MDIEPFNVAHTIMFNGLRLTRYKKSLINILYLYKTSNTIIVYAELFLFINSGQLLFYLMVCIVISTTPSELYFSAFL